MKQKETGKHGLTKQVTQFLKIMEGVHDICWYRNQQGLGSKRGRPDFEIILTQHHWTWIDTRNGQVGLTPITIFVELKSEQGILSHYQKVEKERIEKAGAGELYYIIRSLDDLVMIFHNYGYDRVEIQNPVSTKTKPNRRWWR